MQNSSAILIDFCRLYSDSAKILKCDLQKKLPISFKYWQNLLNQR